MSHGLARCCGGAQPRWPYRRPAAGRPGTVLSPLVGLLAPSGPAGLQWEAAAALWDLCIGNTLTQDSVRECGGIAALVALLAPGRSAGMQRLAAGALATICSFNMRNMDSVRVCGGVAALVGLLAPGVAPDHVRARAALTLGNFCLENAQNQDSVRACGGVAALVALLAPGGSANVPELAARALDMCIGNTRNQDSVRECGGGAALVALLAPGCSARVRKRVVSALANLCVQSVKVQDCVRECGGVGARASHQWKHAEPGCSQGMRGGCSLGARACMRRLRCGAPAGGGCAVQPGALSAGCWRVRRAKERAKPSYGRGAAAVLLAATATNTACHARPGARFLKHWAGACECLNLLSCVVARGFARVRGVDGRARRVASLTYCDKV